MVVLDETKESKRQRSSPPPRMNQYIQPSPMEFDSKISPLAMLTQTCDKFASEMLNDNPRAQSGRPATSSSGSAALADSINNNNGYPALQKSPLKHESPLSPPTVARPKSSSTSISSLSSPSLPDMPLDLKAREGSHISPPHSRSSPHRTENGFKPKSPKSTSPSIRPGSAHRASSNSSSSPPSPFGMMSLLAPTPPTSSSSGHGMHGLGQSCNNPMCGDPSCPTFLIRNAQAQMYSAQAYAASLGMHGGLHGASMMLPGLSAAFSSLIHTPTTVAPSLSSPPITCNWVQGSDYCGRRFSTSEDLMSHLRTHTTPTAPSPSPTNPALAMFQAAQAQAMMPVSTCTSALAMLQAQASRVAAAAASTTTTSSTSSPLKSSSSVERHHPYARPSPSAMSMAGLPPGFPPHLAAAMFQNPFASASALGGAHPGIVPYPSLLYP